MELNLRKARKLEGKIQSHLDESRITAHASIRVLGTIDEAKAAQAEARKEALAKLPEREALLKARYDIRRQIEIKNESIGINKLINEKVLLDKLVQDQTANSFVPGPEGLAFDDQFNLQLAQYNAPTDSYNRHKQSAFMVNALAKADTEAFVVKRLGYKKAIELIEDQIGEKNIVGKVTLTEDTVKLLQSSGLI